MKCDGIVDLLCKDFVVLDRYTPVSRAVREIENGGKNYVLVKSERGAVSGLLRVRDLAGYLGSRLMMDCRMTPVKVMDADSASFNYYGKVDYADLGTCVVVEDSDGEVRGVIDPEVLCADPFAGLFRSHIEKEIRLIETHHRIKNNLQLLKSLLYMVAGPDDGVEGSGTRFEERLGRVIDSISYLHDSLSHSVGSDEVLMAREIVNITGPLTALYDTKARGVTLHIDVDPDDLRLGFSQANAVNLIVCELVSNALEHAFPSDSCEEGCVVEVALGVKNGDSLVLSVADNGVGLPQDHVPGGGGGGNGLGLKLVDSFVGQLHGEMEVVADDYGTRFSLRFPRSLPKEGGPGPKRFPD